MALDNLDNPGVYVGTSTGQVFYSRDAGDSREMLADFLPPVLSVEVFVLDLLPVSHAHISCNMYKTALLHPGHVIPYLCA